MSGPRAPIQSYKQIRQDAPASVGAGTNTYSMVVGVDSYTGPSAQNNEVPTGAVIAAIDIQGTVSNLVSVTMNTWVSIQHIRSGQAAISPRATGGDPQRNQVHLQLLRSTGKDQNQNFHIKFKVPKRFGRVREGDVWQLVTNSDQTHTEAWQTIYKFYR